MAGSPLHLYLLFLEHLVKHSHHSAGEEHAGGWAVTLLPDHVCRYAAGADHIRVEREPSRLTRGPCWCLLPSSPYC